MKICIPFTPMPASENPNINSKSDLKSLKSYYEAMIVEFFSLRMFNNDASLVLITTESPPPEYLKQFEKFDVSIKIVPFNNRPPKGYSSKFLGCFYLLDALSENEEEDCLYLDPDVICLKSIEPLLPSNQGIKAYELEIDRDSIISGLSINDSRLVADEIFHRNFGLTLEYKFYGGEFYFIPSDQRQLCKELIESLYLSSRDRFSQGLSYFPTEEHLFSAAFSKLKVNNANNIIRRVWTAPSFRNVKGDEMSMALLHFPAEKEWGFRKTYKKIVGMDTSRLTLSEFEFLELIEKNFQLRRRSTLRLFYRAITKLVNLVWQALNSTFR